MYHRTGAYTATAPSSPHAPPASRSSDLGNPRESYVPGVKKLVLGRAGPLGSLLQHLFSFGLVRAHDTLIVKYFKYLSDLQ